MVLVGNMFQHRFDLSTSSCRMKTLPLHYLLIWYRCWSLFDPYFIYLYIHMKWMYQLCYVCCDDVANKIWFADIVSWHCFYLWWLANIVGWHCFTCGDWLTLLADIVFTCGDWLTLLADIVFTCSDWLTLLADIVFTCGDWLTLLADIVLPVVIGWHCWLTLSYL